MTSTNLKVFWKFLGRNKVYTAINFVGFTAAMVFVILLGLYVAGESRVDKFHDKCDRVFRLTSTPHGRGEYLWPSLVAGDLAARYPEIESFSRFEVEDVTVSSGAEGAGREMVKAKMMVVDRAFFDIFSFPMLSGDPARQLQASREVTLSESFATRMFGAEDPLGKEIVIYEDPHIVTGVVRDFEDSHLANPDLIVTFDDTHLHPVFFGEYGYRAWNFGVYLLAREHADLPGKAGEMEEFLRTDAKLLETDEGLALEPLTEIYFNPENSYSQAYRVNTRQFIGLLTAAALAILLFAVINYVNLSVALGGFRAREAAMRRLLGGTRRGLLRNYVFESVMFCLAAFVIAMIFAAVIEPTFNSVMKSEVSVVGALKNPLSIAVLVASVLVLGVVSGIYPSLIITRVQPLEVVKGEFSRKTRMVYSRIFIGLQFSLTIVLIACALTIGRQTRYLRTTDLGFDKSNLMYLDNVTEKSGLAGLHDRLMAVPGVEMVSFVAGTPVDGGNNNTTSFDDGTEISLQIFEADSLFLPILGLEKVNETGVAPDSTGMKVWLNETAAREFSTISKDRHSGLAGSDAIAGTVRDFNISRLQRTIPAVVVRVLDWARTEGDPWSILVKVSPGNPAETYKAVQEAYLEYNGGEPFNSGFVDAAIDNWYDDQRRTGTMITGFSLLAVIISAMGLVAMTTYFMRQRARDIAVRKVFGATDGQVLGRLTGGFMRIVAVAFVVAVPVVWWLMRGWLSSFAYRIPLGWTIFALSGVAVGAVAFAAVIWQSLTAARRNPVESLKSE